MTTENIAQAFGLDPGTLSPASHILAMIPIDHDSLLAIASGLLYLAFVWQ